MLVKKQIPSVFSNGDFTFSKFWMLPENFALLVFVFFAMQLLIAIVLRKPYKSREVSFGIYIISIVWSIFAEYSYLPPELWVKALVYLGIGILAFIVMFAPWVCVVLLSLAIPYIAGIDTYELEDGRILPSTFGYRIKVIEDVDADFLDTLAERLGFAKVTVRVKPTLSSELLYYSKENLLLSVIFRKEKEHSADVIFSFFSVINDAVEDYENKEEILDHKAQILALLNVRKETSQKIIIEQIDSVEPSMDDLRLLAEGLGRKEIPSRDQVKRTLSNFPKAHPFWFSLILVVIGGVIVEGLRIWLENLP